MASEQVREVVVRRHVFTSERPFASVLDGIYGGISQPLSGHANTNQELVAAARAQIADLASGQQPGG